MILDYVGNIIQVINGADLPDGEAKGGYPTKYVQIPANGYYFCMTVKLGTSWDRRSGFSLNHVEQTNGSIVGAYGAEIADSSTRRTVDGILTGAQLDAVFSGRTDSVEETNLYKSSMNISGYWITPEGTYSSNSSSYYAKIPVVQGAKYLYGYGVDRIFYARSAGGVLILNKAGETMQVIDGGTLPDGPDVDDNPTKFITIPKNGYFMCLTTKLATTFDYRQSIIFYHVTQTGGNLVSLYGAQVSDAGKWAALKWAAVGDSLTEHNLRSNLNYHDYVAEASGITVSNMGRSGTGYMRTYDEGYAFYQRILNVPTDADVVTIFGSGNDLNFSAMGFNTFAEALGTPTDTGTTTICGCINKTIENLYSVLPTVQLGIVTPCPWISYNPATPDNFMDLYSQAIIQICKNHGIPCLDLYHCSGLRPWESSYRELCYSKDEGNGVHPNELGHKILSSHFMVFLEELISTY